MDAAARTVVSDTAERIVELLWTTPNLVALFDASDRLILANPSFCEADFADPAEKPYWRQFMRENFAHGRGPLIQTSDIDGWLTAADARRGTVPFRAFEAEMTDGRVFWVTETVDRHGMLLLVASEITALQGPSRNIRGERDEARRASWTDDLTGVANRRYVMKTLKEWRSHQIQQELAGENAIALIDIDHFKTVNDTLGHQVGDRVLVELTARLGSHLRASDVLARWGGEEFVVLMRHCTLAEVLPLAEKMRALVAETPFDGVGTVTISIGIAELQPKDDLATWLDRADQAMYDAKSAGRNAVRART
jgi:diguanylate cyclase (GGDEF)-like protein